MNAASLIVAAFLLGSVAAFNSHAFYNNLDAAQKAIVKPAERPVRANSQPLGDGDVAETIVTAHTFAPYLLDDGGVMSSVPVHWEFGLHTVVTDDYVRLTPEEPSREGYLWNTIPLFLASWSAHLGFRVHGHNTRGADGFVLWLSSRQFTSGGSLYGASDSSEPWEGFGIVFDSFDNDGANDNPMIAVIKGADTPGGFAPKHRASDDVRSTRIASCVFDFRVGHADKSLATLKLDFADGELSIAVKKGSHNKHCATVPLGTLPLGKLYFGFTGHTGGLADAHDLHHFVVTTHEKDVNEERKAEVQALEWIKAQSTTNAATAAGATPPPQATGDAAPSSGEPKPTATAGGANPRAPMPFSHDDEKAEKERWQSVKS